MTSKENRQDVERERWGWWEGQKLGGITVLGGLSHPVLAAGTTWISRTFPMDLEKDS